MSLRTPLSEAKGLGSAKEGASHWWMQRLTAVALVPLAIWFAFAVAMLGNASYETVLHWLQSPIVTVFFNFICCDNFLSYSARLTGNRRRLRGRLVKNCLTCLNKLPLHLIGSCWDYRPAKNLFIKSA